MSWPSKKAGSDPLLWGRNSISDVIADARASLQQPSRPFTPRNLVQVRLSFVNSYHSILRLIPGSLTSRAQCSSIGAAPVDTSASAPSCTSALISAISLQIYLRNSCLISRQTDPLPLRRTLGLRNFGPPVTSWRWHPLAQAGPERRIDRALCRGTALAINSAVHQFCRKIQQLSCLIAIISQTHCLSLA
jgi:hypothetical protein